MIPDKRTPQINDNKSSLGYLRLFSETLNKKELFQTSSSLRSEMSNCIKSTPTTNSVVAGRMWSLAANCGISEKLLHLVLQWNYAPFSLNFPLFCFVFLGDISVKEELIYFAPCSLIDVWHLGSFSVRQIVLFQVVKEMRISKEERKAKFCLKARMQNCKREFS